jgi:uncharacterized membrane protein
MRGAVIVESRQIVVTLEASVAFQAGPHKPRGRETIMDESIRLLAHELLESGVASLTERERRVIARIASKRHVTRNLNASVAETSTFGEQLADGVARWGGSWWFIGAFAVFLVGWSLLNALLLPGQDRFDPYPFIFLNLLLSMLAAVQAPIIMMSQNRQAARDRLQATMDYEVNLKAELEIQELDAKLDKLLDLAGK